MDCILVQTSLIKTLNYPSCLFCVPAWLVLSISEYFWILPKLTDIQMIAKICIDNVNILKPSLTPYWHYGTALRHPHASQPTSVNAPYSLFWCLWVRVGYVDHVFGLWDSSWSIQGETCRLNTLSLALYLTPGWFNSTPFTRTHTHIHVHTCFACHPSIPPSGLVLIPFTRPLHPMQYNFRAKTTSMQV